ncbi:Ubiquitin domain-containing protein ubfd1 [Irineochytrium annulatum]|nr:Ubiquitin domain-containing protein ubfd1 [Irineochytrium annulatum]
MLIKVAYRKEIYDIELEPTSTVAELKKEIESRTNISPPLQKVIFKGILKDELTLEDAKLTGGAKVMLMASQAQDILNVALPTVAASAETKQTSFKKAILEATEHQKIISKGPPADVETAIEGGVKAAIPSRGIVGLVNSRGGKTRLSFLSDEMQIATSDRTQKVAFTSIKEVLSEPIPEYPSYYAMSFQLGPTTKSQFWVYWVPKQYVESIKDAILGPFQLWG